MKSLLFVTLFGAALSLPSSFNSAGVCTSKECQEVAEIIKESLNEDADPCEDFYAFACGGFKKRHPLPKRAQNVDGLSLVRKELDTRLVGLLDHPKLKNHGSKVIRKAKKLYDDCIDGNLRENATEPLADKVFVKQSDSLVPLGIYKSQSLNNDREAGCRSNVAFKYPFVLVRLYLDKYFSITEHKAARDVTLNVWKALRNDIIKKVPWMTNETMENVNQGLDDLEINTGYPDWLVDDEELDKEYEGKQHPEWPMNPLTVNAHFNPPVPEISKYDLSVVYKNILNNDFTINSNPCWNPSSTDL